MKTLHILATVPALAIAAVCASCTDEAGDIGIGLTRGEVIIDIDSTFHVSGAGSAAPEFDSKNRALLLGRLNVPEYGDLDCSFVSQLMPGSSIDIPDSIPVENVTGMRMKLMVPNGAFTGDSLAPQKVEVYRLTKQLPADIDNTFDPTGYYETTPVASRNYTASALGMKDTVFNMSYRLINLDFPVESARRVYSQYRTDPSVFQWPERLAEIFPGIFARNTFGKGLVVDVGNTEFAIYYNYKTRVNKVVDGVVVSVDTIRTDSATVFTISPEVLSSNNIRLRPAESIKQRVAAGEAVIQSPGGYNVTLDFPATEIIEKYHEADFSLAVVNSLTFQLPIRHIANDYGINPPPYLLMIKTSKMQEFFDNNKTPQGYIGEETDPDAFWAQYDSSNGSYTFGAMRPYILDLMEKGSVTDEDCRFTIIPVEIRTETWGGSGNTKTFVSSCLPYITRPTMGVFNFDASKVRFTFSRKKID